MDDIQLNVESNGLKWWDGDRPVGIGVRAGDIKRYLPFGHKPGGNLDEATVKRWAERELRGKRITNINTRFDVHMLREWGVDLEAQGCVVSDVAHYAALLDDHRQRFSLDTLIEDFLGPIEIPRVNERRMADYHAGVVAARAEYQVETVARLKDVFWPRLTAEGLHKVRELEDDVIFVVCEMEKNGARIDVEKLDIWLKQAKHEYERCLYDVMKETGIQVNPNSGKDMEKLFNHLKLPVTRTAAGNPSFTASILRSIQHPTIKRLVRASQLDDLLSKYLVPYARTVDRKTGILRYALHQLRAQKDPWSEDTKGTVSGRFSSTKVLDKRAGHDEDVGMNIQQIMKTWKQRVMMGYDEDDDSHDHEIYPVRELHIADEGDFLSSDAMQVEYRLFAGETKSKRLIDAYHAEPAQDEKGAWIAGPNLSFHKLMHRRFKEYKPDMTYRRTKDVNFAKIYGAGIRKMALMMGFITMEEWRELSRPSNKTWRSDPRLAETLEIDALYTKLIPESKTLLDRAKKLAEDRGYIKTLLGRRSRFKEMRWESSIAADIDTFLSVYFGTPMRSHKALNTRIQGSAADIGKLKLVELHKARRETGLLLRFPVHDEVVGDAREKDTAAKVNAILNYQSVKFPVPILWDTSTGPNWKACA
jgi:DNA polymerase-1